MPLTGTKYDVQSRNPAVTLMAIQVAIGSSGAPTVTYGRGVTIARSATGDYTVTLSDAVGGVNAILHGSAFLHVQSDLDRTVVGKGISESAGTFAFSVLAGATPTDPASGDTITVLLAVRNTTAT